MTKTMKALTSLLFGALLFAALAAYASADPGNSGNGISIVKNGNANAVILVQPDADDQTLQAADTLAEYIEKSTGALLPIKTEAELVGGEHGKRFIFVGYVGTGGDPDTYAELEGLRDDGFVIRPHGKTVAIVGASPLGTEYGVYDFLERYVGVRWLIPGPDGEDVPQLADLTVPREPVKEDPAYWSRNMYPLHYQNVGGNRPERYQWGVFNRLRNQNPGWEHNVWRFFPPAVYQNTHPEFYPRKDGVPQIPAASWGWQPCFSNEDTIQVAADWIINYFNQNPHETAISLAVNDNGNYCEQQPDHPNYVSKRNSIGLTDMSDIYFDWVNKVVEKVLQVHPDKWFGVLAYQEVYDPPSFPLHERVIPYLTKDRMAWLDEGVRIKDQAIVAGWMEKASHIGFYDYIYGTPYVLPRVYNHHMADVLKYGHENGARAFFGELGPNWGEGPKPYVLAKLMWDPYQDVDALLDEWYERMVGPAAAPYLKAFYDHWEDFWENRIVQTDWFQSRKNIVYFLFNSAAYLSIVTDEEIAQSRAWLEAAVAHAQTDKQKARAELVLRAFEYYEASALSYPKQVSAPTDAASAIALLEESANYRERVHYAQKRLQLLDEFADDPVLYHSSDARRQNMVWSGLNGNAFWHLVDYIKANEPAGGPVTQRAEELAAEDNAQGVYARLVLQAVQEGPVNLNASFEEAGDPNADVTAAHWNANITNFGKFERKEEMPFTGNASIYVHNFYFGDLNQTVDAVPGLAITRLKYYVTPDTRTVGDIWLELNLLGENGEELATIKSEQQPFSQSLGRWATIQIMDQIPPRVNDVPVKQVRMKAVVNGFFEGGTMYLDDFELYQMTDPELLPLLASAQAAAGEIAVTFNKLPEQEPSAADFTVIRYGEGAPETVPVSGVQWDAQTKTAVLTVPELSAQPWERAVYYDVGFGGQDTVRSNTHVIPRLERYIPVMQNSSFEQWTDNRPDGWSFWGEFFERSATVKRTGAYSLTVDGFYPAQIAAGGGGPIQNNVPIQPGHYVGVTHYLMEAESDGTLYMTLLIYDENGAALKRESSVKVLPAESGGHWTTLTYEFDVLPDYNGRKPHHGQVLVHMENIERGERIYLDDIELLFYDDSPAGPQTVEADGQTLSVRFNWPPEQEPTAADFVVERWNGLERVPVIPESFAWDAASLTATFTVPELNERLPWEQRVEYEVAYAGQPAVSSQPVIVPRQEGVVPVTLNSSFEQWIDSSLEHWGFWGQFFERSDTVKRTGERSLTINGLDPWQIAAGGGGPFQNNVPLEPGRYVGAAHYLMTAETEGTVRLSLSIRDANNTAIASAATQRAVPSADGKWTTIFFEVDIQPQYNGRQPSHGQLLFHLENIERGKRIYMDDVELIRIGDLPSN